MKPSMQTWMLALQTHIQQGKLFLIFSIFSLTIPIQISGQIDSLFGFDKKGALKHASSANTKTEKNAIYKASERAYLKRKYFYSMQVAPQKDLLPKAKTIQNNCENIDFENNSIIGWEVTGDYEIVSKGVDTFGGFSKVFPGAGKHSLKLNNNNVNKDSNFSSKLFRTIKVSPASSFFNLHFAMVILNFPHDSISAARFSIKLIDANNGETLCPNFNCYYASNTGAVGVNNFSVSSVNGINTYSENYEVSYSPWQTVGIDLSSYLDKTLSIEISCNWCIYSVDWAYCYIDADCNNPIAEKITCINLPYQLSAPQGYTNCKWYGPKGQIISQTQTCAANSSGVYTLQCNQTKGCNQLPFTYLFSVSGKPNLDFNVKTQPCDLNVELNAFTISLEESNNLSYLWKGSDAQIKSNLSSANYLYTTSGKKWAQLIVSNKEGCTYTIAHSFNLTAPVNFSVKLLSNSNVLSEENNEVEFLATNNTNYSTLKYDWIGEAFYETGNKVRIFKDGLYTVVGTDILSQCTNSVNIKVESNSPIKIIFTPNNDGTNDSFTFKWTNYQINQAQIFDRWGNSVYETNGANQKVAWDGNNKHGKQCADGIFYYLIDYKTVEGLNKAEHGTICLLR